MVYAHEAHCNVVHEAGPKPCPPTCELEGHGVGRCPLHDLVIAGSLTELSEADVPRLRLGPGDQLSPSVRRCAGPCGRPIAKGDVVRIGAVSVAHTDCDDPKLEGES